VEFGSFIGSLVQFSIARQHESIALRKRRQMVVELSGPFSTMEAAFVGGLLHGGCLVRLCLAVKRRQLHKGTTGKRSAPGQSSSFKLKTYIKPELQTDSNVRLGFAMNGKIRSLVTCVKRESEAKAGLKTNV
jgi:hypothetical protein